MYNYALDSIGSYKELMSTTGLNIEDEVNADGESQLQPGCWVTCSNSGYAVLHWTPAKSPQGSEDWVALYQDVNKSNDHFISGSWHWALNESSYVTSVAFSPGLQARYIKEGSPYIALRRSKPIAKGYLDLEKIYTSTESDPKKIMIDQLSNAVNGKRPSVFSEGMWPFPKELPYKVLSYEEVKVISRFLEPQSYDDVITIYYETYKTALKTDDAGERNAKRHAVWQISMMYKFGEHFAREIGAAHEKGRPGTKEDRRVNGLNNAAAIKYAKEHPGIDPLEAADEMWKKGLLIGYNDGERPEHTKDEW